jgi:hypothetical protein
VLGNPNSATRRSGFIPVLVRTLSCGYIQDWVAMAISIAAPHGFMPTKQKAAKRSACH